MSRVDAAAPRIRGVAATAAAPPRRRFGTASGRVDAAAPRIRRDRRGATAATIPGLCSARLCEHQALASIAKQTRSRPDAPVARRLAPVALALASRAAARAAPAPV